jgi:hypothetical protein
VALHNSAKRGDIVGVEGFPGKSKMGELSIFPRKFVVLSPCLHMPPTVRSGLKDQVRICVALSTHAQLPARSAGCSSTGRKCLAWRRMSWSQYSVDVWCLR